MIGALTGIAALLAFCCLCCCVAYAQGFGLFARDGDDDEKQKLTGGATARGV